MNNTSWTNSTPRVDTAMTGAGTTTNYTHVILYSFLLLCSLLGNVLVIAVVFGNRNLRTNFNHIIVNMAVSDLFIPLLILPMRIIGELNGQEWLVDGPLGEALCKLCFFFSDISPAVSVFSLVIIAVNRYISIAHPMRSQVFSRKKSCVLISFTWIMSALLFSPYLYIFHLYYDRGFTGCAWWWPSHNQLATTIFYSIVTATIFVIPMIAIIVMYSLMAYKIKLNSKNIEGMLNDKQARKRRERNNNIFYVSIVIVCCFVFLWGPYHCFVAVFLTGNSPSDPMVTFVVQFLGYLNSAVNPCVYFIFLKHFRKGLRNLGKSKNSSRNNSISLLSSRQYKTRQELEK